MLGLSRVKLAEGICNDRTIVRFERQGRNPNIEVVRLLFEKLGLCAEYRRAQIITTNVDALILYNEDLSIAVNADDFKQAFECVEEIKSSINMELSYNKQELKRTENYLLFKAKMISEEMVASNIIDSLGCTLDILMLLRDTEKFFTRSELICIHDLAFEVKTNVSENCINIVREFFAKRELINWNQESL